jgi:hypothetical protein
MTWTLTIERVSNGWILRAPPEAEDYAEYVEVIADGDDQVGAVVSMLWGVADHFGPASNQRLARVVTIGIAPGTAHHDWHPQPCAECECKCDPDQSESDMTTNVDIDPDGPEMSTGRDTIPVAHVPPFDTVDHVHSWLWVDGTPRCECGMTREDMLHALTLPEAIDATLRGEPSDDD